MSAFIEMLMQDVAVVAEFANGLRPKRGIPCVMNFAG